MILDFIIEELFIFYLQKNFHTAPMNSERFIIPIFPPGENL